MAACTVLASSFVMMMAVVPESKMAFLVDRPSTATPPAFTPNNGTVQYVLSMTGAKRMGPV